MKLSIQTQFSLAKLQNDALHAGRTAPVPEKKLAHQRAKALEEAIAIVHVANTMGDALAALSGAAYAVIDAAKVAETVGVPKGELARFSARSDAFMAALDALLVEQRAEDRQQAVA